MLTTQAQTEAALARAPAVKTVKRGKRQILAVVTDTPCGGSCQWAIGDSCNCSCGGKNHGVLIDGLFKRVKPWWQALPISELRLEASHRQAREELSPGTYWMLRGYNAIGEAVVTDEQTALDRNWLVIRWHYKHGEPRVAAAPMSRLIPLSAEAFKSLRKSYAAVTRG